MDRVPLTDTRSGTDEMPTFMVGGLSHHHKGRLRKCPWHTRRAWGPR